MRSLYCILFLLVFAYPACSLMINEVMYNPDGGDAGNEWVELYNNDTIAYNLTDWKLNTDNTDHTLNTPPVNNGTGSMVIEPASYIIIAQNAASFLTTYQYSGTVIDSSWPDLANSANETLWLRNSTDVFQNVTTFANVTEGNTFCFTDDKYMECTATPGTQNSPYLETNSTPAPRSPILTQNSTEQENTCNLNMEINQDSTVYNLSTICFDLIVNDTNCTTTNVTIDYYIQDLFGNVVKPAVNVTSSMTCYLALHRQWTPDTLQGSEAYYIIGNVTATDCTSTGSATKLLVVKGTNVPVDSSLEISAPDSIKYGEPLKVNLLAYRGDTAKYAIDVFVEAAEGKLSSVSTVHAKNKLTEYDFQVPVQMKSNCDNSLKDGEYDIVAEGLDIVAKAKINVSGISSSNCKTVTVSTGSGGGGGGGGTGTYTAPATSYYEIVDYENEAAAGEVISTTVKITNNFTIQKNFTVYSYVYRGTTPVSSGLNDKNEWKGTYTANSMTLLLKQRESKTIALKNRIDNDTDQGMYTLKVRIKVDGKDTDLTKDLYVTKPAAMAPGNSLVIINTTKETVVNVTQVANKTTSKEKPLEKVSTMTGMATGKQLDLGNMFQPPIIVIFKFLLTLFP